MSQGLLDGDRRNISQPEILFLEIRKHGSKVLVV
jgi:hypothetical protein